jgi:hypothetical protein
MPTWVCPKMFAYTKKIINYCTHGITILVTNALQREEIDKLKRRLKENRSCLRELNLESPIDLALSGPSTSSTSTNGSASGSYSRLLYVKVGT